MPLVIPTSKQPPLTREPRNLFLYGRPKVGKSTVCSVLPDALHVDTQQGTLYVATQRVLVNTPDEYMELMRALPSHHKAHPFKFLVVDVLDTLEDWAERTGTDYYKSMPTGRNFGGESVLELDHGGGYMYLRNAFKKLMLPAMANDKWTTVFVGHVRDKYSVEGAKTTAEVVEGDFDLTGKCKSIVAGLMDAIAFVYRDAMGVLKLSFFTKASLNCGNRCAHLAGKTLAFSTPPKASEWAQIYPDSLASPVTPTTSTP